MSAVNSKFRIKIAPLHWQNSKRIAQKRKNPASLSGNSLLPAQDPSAAWLKDPSGKLSSFSDPQLLCWCHRQVYSNSERLIKLPCQNRIGFSSTHWNSEKCKATLTDGYNSRLCLLLLFPFIFCPIVTTRSGEQSLKSKGIPCCHQNLHLCWKISSLFLFWSQFKK